MQSNSIIIIDYGMGNLRSVYNKFHRIGIPCEISSDLEIITKADKLILPGVGHFKSGMQHLKENGIADILTKKVLEDKVPILGICLGVQLFTKYSEEGESEGLGWIEATTIRFKINNRIKYKIPHIGWNTIKIINSNSLDSSLQEDDTFYFVHSYHLDCQDEKQIWMKSTYEYEFISAVRTENIYGVQFHPEKSHDSGIKLLKKFAEL